jgi:hypothetical protein
MPKKNIPSKKKSIAIIRKHMALHNIAVVTKYSSYKEDEILCDPIIWVDDDIKDRGFTMDQWHSIDRSGRTLHERSTEEGWEIINIILGDLVEPDSDEDESEEANNQQSNPA